MMFAGWFAQLCARAVSVLASLVSMAVLAQKLGPAGFGQWTVVVAWVGLVTPLADLGLTQTLLRRPLTGPGGPGSLDATIGGALGLQLLVTSLAVPVAALAGAALLRGSPLVYLAGVASLLPTGVYLVLQIPLAARGRFVALAMVEGAARLITASVTVIAATSGVRPPGLLLLLSAPAVVGVLVLLGTGRGVQNRRPRFDLVLAKELLRAGLPVMMSLALFGVYLRVDSLLLSVLTHSTDVGVYGLAYRVVEAVLAVPGLLMMVIYPRMAALRYQPEALRLLVTQTTGLLAVVAAPVLLAALVAAPDVMEALGGSAYAGGGLTLGLLLLSSVASFGTALLGQLLIAQGASRYLLGFSIGNVVINIGANLVLIPMIGLPGAAMSTLLTELIAIGVVGRRAVREGSLAVPWGCFGRVAGCVALALAARAASDVMLPGRGADLAALVTLVGLLVVSQPCDLRLLSDLVSEHA